MKFAIAIALFVLGQCLVAEAGFVRCTTFNSYVNKAARDRGNQRNVLNSVVSSYKTYNRNMDSYNSRLNSVDSGINSARRSGRSLKGCIDADVRKANVQKGYIDGYARRIAKFAGIAKCFFDENPVLQCLFLEVSN